VIRSRYPESERQPLDPSPSSAPTGARARPAASPGAEASLEVSRPVPPPGLAQPGLAQPAVVQTPARPQAAALTRRIGAPLGIFAASRVGLGLVLFFALKLPGALGASRFLAYWDGGWYLQIAEHGYPKALVAAPNQSDHAFFPLYPLCIRALHDVTGSWVGSAVAVTLVFSALAMVVIFLLVERLAGEQVALRSVALISFFPWAFIFSFAYSEGLLLLLASICLLALLDEHWIVAGVAAGLASAARPNGFVLFLPCAWAAFVAIRRTRSVKPLLAPVLAPLGILGFFTYLQLRTGDFFANLDARQRGWSSHGIEFQASQFGKVVSTYLAHPFNDLNRTASVAILLLSVVSIVLMVRWRPPAILWLYTVPVLGLAAYYDTYASAPRFYLTAFPLVVAIARPLKDAPFWIVVAVSAMTMAALFCLVGTTTWLVP
jgi:hypothetical protein